MSLYDELRRKHGSFIYHSYEFTEQDGSTLLRFHFSIDEYHFYPGWTFPEEFSGLTFDRELADRIAFSLGMAELVSYWKCACPPVVEIRCGGLSEEQKLWWKKLYFNGLGEFFYRNGITPGFDSFMTINAPEPSELTPRTNSLSGFMVPIGGGKDSVVTLELLRKAGVDISAYIINPRGATLGCAEAAGIPESRVIAPKRAIDKQLLELNKMGYLNGHTPFSSIVAFSAEITAYLYGSKYIVLSNEASANESTVAGQEVNHQYSKSFEFEADFHEYEKKYLRTGIYYFSFLRPLAEFQIAKMFVAHKKYLPIFRSCNLGSKVSPDIWCGECPKCLFVCLILSPFLSLDELCGIFGRDMLNDEKMTDYFVELAGMSDHKPFECVGSIDEVRLAVSLAIRRLMAEGQKLPLMFEKFIDLGLYKPQDIDALNEACCNSYNEQNLLPDEFKTILKNEMRHLL